MWSGSCSDESVVNKESIVLGLFEISSTNFYSTPFFRLLFYQPSVSVTKHYLFLFSLFQNGKHSLPKFFDKRGRYELHH